MMRTWTVGDFTISEIQELRADLGLFDGLIPGATPDVIRSVEWLRPDYANDSGQILFDLHCYVIDTGEQTILVDAGCGNHKNYPMQPVWTGLTTPFLERLSDAGFTREDIDVVLLTHLHLDHVGWCSMLDADGEWVPAFPNARLILIDAEYERHLAQIVPPDSEASGEESSADLDPIARAFLPDANAVSAQASLIQEESLQPVVDAGLLDLVPPNSTIAPGVHYQATPGHTSAHHSVRVESGSESAFITGDFIHHPMQIARPEWSSVGDFDPDLSGRTRREFLRSAAGTNVLVLGTHFTGPGAGYIVEDDDGFRLTQDKPS